MKSIFRSWNARTLGAGLALALTAAGGHASAAEQVDLKDCVSQLVPVPVPLSAQSPVGAVQDIGNLTVMELSGDYDRGLVEPRQQVATRFYATHPDQYDFIVVFSTFEFPTGIAVAFYNTVRNDTQGLGQAPFDFSAAYGSTSGKLQGYIDMAAVSRYSFVPSDPRYQFTLSTLAHEIQHRWGSYIAFNDSHGQLSADLIGQQGAHWSYFLGTDASIMYGSDWRVQGDGKFHAVDIRHRYSPLDMYLAGLAAPGEVPPFTLIRNGDGGVATDFPVLDAVSGGQGETVTIEQVIAANGARVPSAANAQKQFKAAMILLKRPGEHVAPDLLLELERYRERFQQEYAQMTDGRGLVRIYTQTSNATASLPTILHGSGDTAAPSGVAGAIAWLQAQQHADGHWEDRPGTAVRDTAAVMQALYELAPAFSLTSATVWLDNHAPANLDEAARQRRFVGSSRAAQIDQLLRAAQGADAGFGILPGWNSTPIDTAVVASQAAAAPIRSSDAQLYMASEQNADGSYGFSARGRGRVLPTLQAATLLSGESDYTVVQQRIATWLSTQVGIDGGIGGDASRSSLVDTIETYSTFGVLQPSPTMAAGVRQVVRNRQQISGDWGGSVYLTARAVLAYVHDQQGNLAIDGALVANPALPVDGDPVRLSAIVIDSGALPTPATIARWYDGDPDNGGVQIGGDVAVPALSAQSHGVVSTVWDSSGRAGNHVVWLVLDPANAVAESSEGDNRSSLALSVATPGNQADLALTSGDLALTPASFTTLPSNEHLAGTLHNLGLSGVSGAVVRVYAKPDLTHALAETTIDVGGRGTAPFALDFAVTSAQTLNLLVRVDPDNVIAESNEGNNEASVTLPFGQSLDLEITAADLSIEQAAPRVGQDIAFDVTVRNRGTVDSPATVLHADVVQGATTNAIVDASVQIAAGQSITRRLTWRANQPGAAQLRVTIDANNQLTETREDNNSATLDFNVGALTQADLTFVVNSLAFVPTPAQQGQALTASLLVRNLSSVATGSFRVSVYAADPRGGVPPIGSTVVSNVDGSADQLVTIVMPDFEVPAGDHTLYAFIDSDNAIAEIDETNNVVIAPLHVVGLPDIGVSVADMVLTPALPVPGQPVQAQVTVRNFGGQDAHNVAVRLLEGDAGGAAVGTDQVVSTLAAGASTVLTWNWTLSPDAHAVTVVADPGNTVHETNEDNNAATLPFDVQDGNFFANQRYISPNGDGVQDETAIVFALTHAGAAELDIVNGVQYTVRHFGNVALSDTLRGQVIWEGRDDHGRIVPDGDYHLVAIDAAGGKTLGPVVTVDNNRSSALEAFDTPYGVFTDTLHDNFNHVINSVQIPPAGSPLHEQMFGLWASPSALGQSSDIQGLYRTETLLPDGIPVISANWLINYAAIHHLSTVRLDQFAIGPDGQQVAAVVFGTGQPASFGVVTTAADQVDAARTQTVMTGIYQVPVFGFLDADTLVFGPTADNMLQILTVSTGQVRPWRSFVMPSFFATFTYTPHGLLVQDVAEDFFTTRQTLLPRDSAQAALPLNTLSAIAGSESGNGVDYEYFSRLSPQRSALVVYERNAASETLDFVDLASSSRQTLRSNASRLLHGDLDGATRSVGRYGADWLEQRDVLLVQDAVTRSVLEFSATGQQLSETNVAADDRVGQYTIERRRDGNQFEDSSKPEEIFSAVPSNLRFHDCHPELGNGVDLGLGRYVYDPTRNTLLLRIGELVVHEEHPEGFSFISDSGLQDYFSVDRDAGSAGIVQQASFLPLIEPADSARFPLQQQCVGAPAADDAALILADGARIRMDGSVQTLSRGVLHKPWSASISGIWPDDTRFLLGSQTFSSLLNSTTVLQARTLGRGIELSGYATDRNFAYYKLDWAPVEQPNSWNVLTPPSGDEVFGDEFLTWVPPQTGSFIIRLTVVDKAGNRRSTTASAAVFSSSLIDNFAMDPKFISPNGDGVQEQLVVKYRVRGPLTLDIHIDDASGNTVRSAPVTYDASSLGPHEFDWNGRNDGGQLVPDGRYRLHVDGFAAWVTVDTTPPTFSHVVFTQPYVGTCDVARAHQFCDPKDNFAASAPSVQASADDDNLAGSATELSLKTGGAWLGATPGVGANEHFGLFRFRIGATDRAGNSATLSLGEGEEQLIFFDIDGQPVRYQAPPLAAPLDPEHQKPPIEPVMIDASPNVPLYFADQSGQLQHVAVETAPSNAPSQWTELISSDVVEDCKPRTIPPFGCRVYIDTRAIPIGTQLLVRLRGERADGSLLYSNQGYFKIGGIDPPACAVEFGGSMEVTSHEYLDGALAVANLRAFGTDKLLATDEHPADHDLMFHMTPVTRIAYIEGIDQRGIRHVSQGATLKCDSPPDPVPTRQFIVRPYPVVSRDRCDAQPGNQEALGFRIIDDLSDAPLPTGREVGFHQTLPAQVKLSYKDALTGATVVLYQATINPDDDYTNLTPYAVFSTAGWPEGSYEGKLEATDVHGNTQSAVVQIPVLKHAPSIDLVKPLSGSRVCAPLQRDGSNLLPMSIDVTSPLENAFQLAIGSGATPANFDCTNGQGALSDGQGCASLLLAHDLTNNNIHADDNDVVMQGDLRKFNGIATLQLKVAGWSGGTVCTNSTVYLDSDVEFVQRKEPSTPLPLNQTQQLGISTNGYAQYGQAQMYFTALEQVQVTATVFGPAGTGGQFVFRALTDAQGDIDIPWNGTIDGHVAPDGGYRIEVQATDGCQFGKTLTYVAFVDSTPPTLAITSPAAGTPTAAAVIEFAGSAHDNFILQSWSLDYSSGGSANWQHIADGTSPVGTEDKPAGTLATWSRGSLTGSVDVRLSGIDLLGNKSEVHLPLTLLDPAKLIAGAQLQPILFSPNGDGAIDTTRVQLGLLQNANISVTAAGRALFSGSAQTGSNAYVWDGKDSGGHVPADGDYPVVINATDPNGVAAPESLTLTATIDDTPPTLSVLQPAGAFAKADDNVVVRMQDLHFSRYDLTLTRSADNAVVASGSGAQGGDQTLTGLAGFQEGAYALHSVARDGAGNVTTRDTAFVLDTTPPTVVLSTPEDGALIAASKPTSVKGSVNDLHLASWTLAVAPATVDTWTDLKTGTANIDAGEILAWTPNLPDGSYRLRLRGVDAAGNSAEAIHAVDVDGTPPGAHIGVPANGAAVRGNFEVDGTASDAHFANYRLSVVRAADLAAGQWSDVYIGNTPVDNAKLAALTLGLAEDDYVLRLIAIDKVGLTATDQVTLRIDTQPPSTPLNLIGHVESNRDSVLDWNAVTASDLAGYYVYRGGAKITPAPVAAIHYVDAGAPEGQLKYYVTAVDRAGNESPASNTVTLYIDHTPPSVSIAKPQQGERIHGAYPIIGTAYSAQDFKQYRLSVVQTNPPGATLQLASSFLPVQGQVLATWDTADPVLHIVDGTAFRVHLEGEDTSGNVASADADIVVDNGPPAAPTGLTAVPSGADAQTHWNPNTESDLLGYLLYRDNVLVNATSTTLPADLRPFALTDTQYLDLAIADGSHTYVVYAIDTAGNISPPSQPATLDPIDNHPPSMIIEQPADNTKFQTSIAVLATSRDTDIATVQFAFRPQGNGSWTNFGSALTSAPYRVTWTPPQGTAYGTYQIRALAQDLGGRVDPAPPMVNVIYADLTPPDAPVNLVAHADADTVHASWSASSAADLDGYRLYRGFQLVNPNALITTTSYDDPGQSDGDYTYTVVAVDKYGNASQASNPATAHVFSLSLIPPYSPISASSATLSGSSAQPGTIAIHDDTDQGSSNGTGATAADGSIALPAQAIAPGSNHFTLRVTDSNGDISRPGDVWVDRGNVPAAPANVAAAVADHDVNLSWNANSESDLLGYRVFRNGHAIAPDIALGETPTGAGTNACFGAGDAIDGNALTYCDGYAYGSGEELAGANDPSLELDWTQPRTLTALRLNWVADYVAATNLDAFAWSGHAWIRVARVRGNTSADQSILLDNAYRTTRLKFVFRAPVDGASQYFQLAEVALTERPTQSATMLAETLIDGTYHYQVTATSQFAFESAPSAEALAAVGDTQGGGKVELSGSLAGNDATLTWTASPSPTVARYDLKRNGVVVVSINATDPRVYLDAGLANGGYDYVVFAYDALGNASAPSNTVSLTVTGFGPGIPVGLTVTDAHTGGELDEAWQPGGGTPAVGYILRRAESASGPFVEIDEPTDTRDIDTGLTNGKTYWYTVEAVDANGLTSGQCAPVSGVPTDRLPPDAPVLTYPTDAFGAVTLHATQSIVCGAADADTLTVELARAGSVVGTAVANAGGFNAFFYDGTDHVVPAPDGAHIATVDYQGFVHIARVDNDVAIYNSDIPTRLQAWAPRGLTLYYAASSGDDLHRWEVGQTAQTVPQPIVGLSAFAVSPDERTLALAGQYTDANGTLDGVWLLSAGSMTPHRVGTLASSDLAGDSALAFAPDGARLLLQTADDHALVADVASGTIAQTLDANGGVTATWSADGKQIAFARANAQGENDIVLHTLATQEQDILRGNVAGLYALAWSPANDSLAISYASQIAIVTVDDGLLQLGQTVFSNRQLVWTRAGRVFVFDGAQVNWIDPAGWFCSDAPVALAVGANLISATALDAGGLRSLPSLPIEIDTPSAGLPDLAIGASDIFFVPPTGKVGQSYGALVLLHNLGSVEVASPVVSVSLTAPDGTRQNLTPQSAFAALAAGGAEEVSYPLGTLNQPGVYRLDVIADPQQQVREADETNNAASATLALSADGTPVLELNLARTIFAPGEAVTGEVAVTNPGTNFDGKVHLSVLDGANVAVADLGDVVVTGLGFGRRFSAPVTWNAQGVFAGPYQLRAQLIGSDGAAIAQQTDPFTIAKVRHVQLALTPDAPSHALGTTVSLHSGVVFSDGNALLAGASLSLAALDPNGVQVWQTQSTLGTLLPGYVLGRDDAWPTAGLAAGVYTLRLTLTSPDLTTSTDASVTLTAAAPTQLLTGSINFDPGTTLIAGQGVVVDYAVNNAGTASLSGVQARLRIVAGAGRTPVTEVDDQYDLAIGATRPATLALTAPPLALLTHAAILEARLPTDPSGQWRLLAQQGFAVVDLLPPAIGILSPPSNVIQPAVVPFRASIVDQHSAVASAEVSVDSGNWQPVSVGADGFYARGLTGLVDGDHVLVVRARDTWGNQAQTGAWPFTVDATPPVIVISGVADGDVVNHAVTPVVTITDAHLESTDVRLDGAPFASGTTLNNDGSYVLTARATDTAHNQSLRSVRFTIDRTPPTVAITAPQDGATVGTSTLHVDVQTEALATVTLATGAYQSSAAADAQGHAGFDNVPLALGANTIAASAVDLAGNSAGPALITVTYTPQSVTPLTGTVQPDATNLAYGTPLGVALSVHNGNAVALPAQQLRVRVLGAASAVLAEQPVAHDFSANETYGANLSFPSAGWPLGAISVTLELNQAGNWTLLDSKAASVVDLTPPLVALTAPSEGAILHGPVALAATASDALSGIASVEASVDAGAFDALTAAGAGTYMSSTLALADGDHTVDLRAHDGAGNQGSAATGHFTIDTQPPLINIAGVAEGDLLNHAVAPTVTITDAHLAASDIRLNGQPYVSATSIASSGDFTLAATASDAAGNQSSSSVHFTLDLDPPTVVFTSPAQNAVVATSAIDVTGTTEGSAHVHLATGGFSIDTDADAAGVFSVSSVPLAAGANAIVAHATDRAGNVGPNATLNVTYQSVGLTGSIATLPSEVIRGLPLEIPYALHNTGNVDFVALPLRIELQPLGGGAVVASDDFSGDLAGGADAQGTRELATTTLALGSYTALLRANLPASPGPGGWVTLDTRNTRVVLAPCRGAIADEIFADDFEGTITVYGDEIFCNGFELAATAAGKLLGLDRAGIGAALWAGTATALPALRAVGPRVRAELVAAAALSNAAHEAAANEAVWHRAWSRLQDRGDERLALRGGAPIPAAWSTAAARQLP